MMMLLLLIFTTATLLIQWHTDQIFWAVTAQLRCYGDE
jgi:hypothetical protein